MSILAISSLVAIVLGILGLLTWAATHKREAQRIAREKRSRFIADYRFPAELSRRFHEKYPALSAEQVRLVLEGLRQYFLACLGAQTNAIAGQCGMPSKAVDDAWHEFIVMTRDYEAFCKQAFGAYLHHTPKLQMQEATRSTVANTLHQLRGAPVAPESWAMLGAVPLLFALDRELGIADGFQHDESSLADLDRHRWTLAQQQQTQAGGTGGDGSASWGGGDNSSCGDGGGGGGSCGGGGGGCGGGGS